MKKLIFLLLFTSLIATGQINIDTPKEYSKVDTNEKGVLYAIQKISNNTIVSTFNLKENNDWSFSLISNDEYIETQKKSKDYDVTLKNFYENFKLITKNDFYFKNIGDAFLVVFSFSEGEVNVINTIFQFIKNNKLYTATGSSVREKYREHFNEYVGILESLKL